MGGRVSYEQHSFPVSVELIYWTLMIVFISLLGVKVLGDMPRKKYHFTRRVPQVEALDIAPGSTLSDALYRVLHLPSVCSKRFLTTKVRVSVY